MNKEVGEKGEAQLLPFFIGIRHLIIYIKRAESKLSTLN